MLELGVIEWGMLILVCISIGISKTALSSLSILSVTMIVMTFPAKTAVGLILPLLIIGDLIALLYYRQHVIWRYLIKLVPWVFAGIIIGYFILGYITDEHLKPLISVLEYHKAAQIEIIEMEQGQKKMRILAWRWE